MSWPGHCFDACRLLKRSKFMVIRTFGKILTHSVMACCCLARAVFGY